MTTNLGSSRSSFPPNSLSAADIRSTAVTLCTTTLFLFPILLKSRERSNMSMTTTRRHGRLYPTSQRWTSTKTPNITKIDEQVKFEHYLLKDKKRCGFPSSLGKEAVRLFFLVAYRRSWLSLLLPQSGKLPLIPTPSKFFMRGLFLDLGSVKSLLRWIGCSCLRFFLPFPFFVRRWCLIFSGFFSFVSWFLLSQMPRLSRQFPPHCALSRFSFSS